ncbi:MAG TPA: hypothetical protein VN867_06410 [Candidatus Binataceae bacterium]|nr:hypothetical protein [Candidatus Binataceae bacterium]
MRPPIEIVFQITALDLLERVVPAISPSYHQGTIGMIASMMSMVGEEWDRAASRRIEENNRLRELFHEASSVVTDGTLKTRLMRLSETRDDDFHISALEKNNCELRATLIELHAQIESQTGADARHLEASIWKELAASTERRRLSSAQF